MSAYRKIMLGKSMTETTDDVETSAVDTQVEKFSNDYTAEKFNELCDEFDSITLDNSTDTISKDNVVAVEKVSSRAKLLLVSAMLIFSLVLTLFIYNFVVINSMQSSINILQGDAIKQEAQVTQRATELDELLDADVIEAEMSELGYGEIASENVTRVAVMSDESAVVSTNWFDKLCEFICSIFGG